MTTERWRPVYGYESLYEVSDIGRVRGLARTESVITRTQGPYVRTRGARYLAQIATRHGYLTVHLSKDGRAERHSVHRLVLEAFAGPCPEGHQGAHGDGNKLNNCFQNLRWATSSENNCDKIRHGTIARGERGGRAILTEEQARAVLTTEATTPVRALARRYGVAYSTIRSIRRGINWRHLRAELAAKGLLAELEATP